MPMARLHAWSIDKSCNWDLFDLSATIRQILNHLDSDSQLRYVLSSQGCLQMVIKIRKIKYLDDRFIIVKIVVAYLVKYRSEIIRKKNRIQQPG